MLRDYDDYAKYIEFMESYEDQLYVLCKDAPEEWSEIKSKLINTQYDVESYDRIYLAAMEATEFFLKVNEDENYIAEHPLLSALSEIDIDTGEEDDDDEDE